MQLTGCAICGGRHMTELEQLKQRARRTYELNRLAVAARISVPILALTALCAIETNASDRTLVLGTALLVIAWMFRWRLYRGSEFVAVGLWAGVMPLAAALALCRFAPYCPPTAAFGLCSSLGIVAGVAIARRCAPASSANQWLATLTVSVLTASMGCLALGIGTALGAAAGVLVGTVATARLVRRTA